MVYSDLVKVSPLGRLAAESVMVVRDRDVRLQPGGPYIQMRQRMNRSIIGRKLKALREQSNLSMRELAARSGTSVSLISKIEAGTVSPTVLSLEKIVESMGVELYEFFLDRLDGDPTQSIVFRKQDMVESGDEERTWRFAFPKHPEIKAQLEYDEFMPHNKLDEKISHKSDALGYVISGELTLEVDGVGTCKATAGDAFYIKAGTSHQARNEGDKTLKLVFVQLRH